MAERTAKGTFARGNTAARTNGVYSFFAVGRMPKGCRAIRESLGKMRRFLEAAARRGPDGQIPLRQAALIHTAVMHEGRRRLLSWYLARKLDELTPDQLIRLSADATAALEARNRCLSGLFPDGAGLDLGALLGGLDGPEGPGIPPQAPDAPQGQPAAGNGMGGSQGVA